MKAATVLDETGYLDFFGLHSNPFPVAPDDDNFYISPHIDQILTEIVHGIITRKGFMVLDGDVGLGKTTIARRILNLLETKGIKSSLVFHTAYKDVELLREINRDFGLELNSLVFGDQMKQLNDFLIKENHMGNNCTIIIDDAQNLEPGSLELIRMLSNIEANQKKLVQILLIGQPELTGKLNSPALRQLRSRIIIWKKAKPLTVTEINHYLPFKFNRAGNNGQLTVSKDAVKTISKITRGNLRQINIIMDRCLYAAYLSETTIITKTIVEEAFKDINPSDYRRIYRIKPIIVTIVTTCLILFLTIFLNTGSSYLIPGMKRFSNQSSSKAFKNTDDKQHQPPHTQESVNLTPINLSRLPMPAKPPKSLELNRSRLPDSSISIFLKAYQLSSYESLFVQAVKTGEFKNLSTQIYEQTGFRLIHLDLLPDFTHEKYDVLVLESDKDDKRQYFLFWHPALKIDVFYYGYQGSEIILLQKKLKELKLYNNDIDGIVGKDVLKGVIRFQKMKNLHITGYPDKKTLFLLFNEKGSQYDSRTTKKISG